MRETTEMTLARIWNLASHAYEMQEGGVMDVSDHLESIMKLIREELPGQKLSEARYDVLAQMNKKIKGKDDER